MLVLLAVGEPGENWRDETFAMRDESEPKPFEVRKSSPAFPPAARGMSCVDAHAAIGTRVWRIWRLADFNCRYLLKIAFKLISSS